MRPAAQIATGTNSHMKWQEHGLGAALSSLPTVSRTMGRRLPTLSDVSSAVAAAAVTSVM